VSELAAFQKSIAHLLMRPLVRGEAMDPISAPAAAQFVLPNERLSAFERLQIYNQQYWWRLLSNFGEDFSGLRAVLGVRKFDRLAQDYLTRCGSTSWNLRNLGQDLESFLRQNPEATAPVTQLAIEMAQLEWAQVEAFDGPQRPPIDPKKIARTAPGRLVLKLQPYLTLLELEYPVDELLRKASSLDHETSSASNAVSRDDAEEPAAKRRAPRLRPRPSPTPIFLAVHRVEFVVYFKRLEPRAFLLLKTLKDGTSLAQACDSALQDWDLPAEQAAAHVQAWFANWMQLGWFCK
jgi:hypothetical protein